MLVTTTKRQIQIIIKKKIVPKLPYMLSKKIILILKHNNHKIFKCQTDRFYFLDPVQTPCKPNDLKHVFFRTMRIGQPIVFNLMNVLKNTLICMHVPVVTRIQLSTTFSVMHLNQQENVEAEALGCHKCILLCVCT